MSSVRGLVDAGWKGEKAGGHTGWVVGAGEFVDGLEAHQGDDHDAVWLLVPRPSWG